VTALVHSAIAAGLLTVLSTTGLSAAPIIALDPYPPGFALPAPLASETSPITEEITALQEPAPVSTSPLSDKFLTIGSASDWFDAGAVEPGISDDRFALQIDPDTCVYPDSYFRAPGGGGSDCRVLRPGADDTGIFTLPFLAVSAWAVIILAGAGFYRVNRTWRARRWLHHLRGQGLAPQKASRRGHAVRRSRQPRSRTRSRRRSYAG
jgi:hypothetical protein